MWVAGPRRQWTWRRCVLECHRDGTLTRLGLLPRAPCPLHPNAAGLASPLPQLAARPAALCCGVLLVPLLLFHAVLPALDMAIGERDLGADADAAAPSSDSEVRGRKQSRAGGRRRFDMAAGRRDATCVGVAGHVESSVEVQCVPACGCRGGGTCGQHEALSQAPAFAAGGRRGGGHACLAAGHAFIVIVLLLTANTLLTTLSHTIPVLYLCVLHIAPLTLPCCSGLCPAPPPAAGTECGAGAGAVPRRTVGRGRHGVHRSGARRRRRRRRRASGAGPLRWHRLVGGLRWVRAGARRGGLCAMPHLAFQGALGSGATATAFTFRPMGCKRTERESGTL